MVLLILYTRDLNLKGKDKYSHKVRNLKSMYIYLAWVRNLQSMYNYILSMNLTLRAPQITVYQKKKLSNNIKYEEYTTKLWSCFRTINLTCILFHNFWFSVWRANMQSLRMMVESSQLNPVRSRTVCCRMERLLSPNKPSTTTTGKDHLYKRIHRVMTRNSSTKCCII